MVANHFYTWPTAWAANSQLAQMYIFRH